MDFKLWLNEGLGDAKIPITEKDISFVHMVRILCARQGIPPPPNAQVLHLRYALLHSLPLHNYSFQKDPQTGHVKIYEKTRKGGFNHFENNQVAVVNGEMINFFKKETGKTPKSEEEVAQWWIEDNKNALHDRMKKGNPAPLVKIISVDPQSISVAFKYKGRFNTVKNIPFNVERFRKRMEEQGYNEKRHGNSIVSSKSFYKLISRSN